MKGTIIIFIALLFGCNKDDKKNKSSIICKWDEEHKICLCSTASPVLEEFSWKSETQFYAPDRLCGKTNEGCPK